MQWQGHASKSDTFSWLAESRRPAVTPTKSTCARGNTHNSKSIKHRGARPTFRLVSARSTREAMVTQEKNEPDKTVPISGDEHVFGLPPKRGNSIGISVVCGRLPEPR